MRVLDDVIVTGPKLAEFTESMRTVCPACGMRPDYWWRRVLRRIRGKRVEEVATFRYCPGEKPPTEERRDLFWSVMGGSREVTNQCAGLMLPHLHCTCKTCGAQWFTGVKTRI